MDSNEPYTMAAAAEISDGAAVCRLCDRNDGGLVNVFEKNGEGKQIVNVIKDLLPIIIYRNDPLSKQICEDCNETLGTLHSFKCQVLDVLAKQKEELSQRSSDLKVKLYLDTISSHNGQTEVVNGVPQQNGQATDTREESTLTNLYGTNRLLRLRPDSTTPEETEFNSDLLSINSALMNGLGDDTATESDMELCEPQKVTILTRRRRCSRDFGYPIVKRRRLIGPKSKVPPNPLIKTTSVTSYHPLSLLHCVVRSMNYQNVPDYTEEPYEVITEDVNEIIPLCVYCDVLFETTKELAQHEITTHIQLNLERVDEFEYWNSDEHDALIRNNWLRDNHPDLQEEAVIEHEDENVADQEADNDQDQDQEALVDELLMPMEDVDMTETVDTSRDPNIVFVNELPTLSGVPMKDIPREERDIFYQSVLLNGVRRKFCKLCRYTFKDNWAVDLHYMSRTCYYACNYCGMKFNKNKPFYAKHVQMHVSSGHKKSHKVFVNKSKYGSTPRELPPSSIRPYIPHERFQNRVKPLKMKTLLEKRKVNPTTLKIKEEVMDEDIQQMTPIKVTTTADLVKSGENQAFFCKKCYKVFTKINDFNVHVDLCTGENNDPEMNVIRPYVRKQQAEAKPQYTQVPIKKEERDNELYSPTGRPVRHCVKEVVSYNDEKEPEYKPAARSLPGHFECSYCSSVFPTVHSRNSHMRIHKSGFKHAANKMPAYMPPQITKQGLRQHRPVSPIEAPLAKRIKQEVGTFEPIVEIHEGHSSKVDNIGSVSITPLNRNNKSSSMSSAIMQLVQNNPNITLKPRTSQSYEYQQQQQQQQQQPQTPINHYEEGSMDTDSGGRSYKCSSCSKPFSNKSNLYFHKKNQCGGSRYPCPFCKKRFGTEASYSSHIFYSHPV